MGVERGGAYQIEEKGLEDGQLGRPHEPSVDERLLGGIVVSPQQDSPVLAKVAVDLLLGQRSNSGKVDSKQQRLERLGDLGQVADGGDEVDLQGRGVGDLEQGVDVLDVQVPEQEALDGGRVGAGEADGGAADDKGEAVAVVEHGVVGVVDGGALVLFVRGLVVVVGGAAVLGVLAGGMEHEGGGHDEGVYEGEVRVRGIWDERSK